MNGSEENRGKKQNLLEKKREQWARERANDPGEWFPFGRDTHVLRSSVKKNLKEDNKVHEESQNQPKEKKSVEVVDDYLKRGNGNAEMSKTAMRKLPEDSPKVQAGDILCEAVSFQQQVEHGASLPPSPYAIPYPPYLPFPFMVQSTASTALPSPAYVYPFWPPYFYSVPDFTKIRPSNGEVKTDAIQYAQPLAVVRPMPEPEQLMHPQNIQQSVTQCEPSVEQHEAASNATVFDKQETTKFAKLKETTSGGPMEDISTKNNESNRPSDNRETSSVLHAWEKARKEAEIRRKAIIFHHVIKDDLAMRRKILGEKNDEECEQIIKEVDQLKLQKQSLKVGTPEQKLKCTPSVVTSQQPRQGSSQRIRQGRSIKPDDVEKPRRSSGKKQQMNTSSLRTENLHLGGTVPLMTSTSLSAKPSTRRMNLLAETPNTISTPNPLFGPVRTRRSTRLAVEAQKRPSLRSESLWQVEFPIIRRHLSGELMPCMKRGERKILDTSACTSPKTTEDQWLPFDGEHPSRKSRNVSRNVPKVEQREEMPSPYGVSPFRKKLTEAGNVVRHREERLPRAIQSPREKPRPLAQPNDDIHLNEGGCPWPALREAFQYRSLTLRSPNRNVEMTEQMKQAREFLKEARQKLRDARNKPASQKSRHFNNESPFDGASTSS